MTFGEGLDLVGVLAASLKARGVLDPAGNFVKVKADVYASVAADVEAALIKDGVAVDPNVDKVIKALPAVLQLLGA